MMKKWLYTGRCTAIGGHRGGQSKLPTPISCTPSLQPRFWKKARFRSKMLRGEPSLPPGCPRSPRGGGTAAGTRQGREGRRGPGCDTATPAGGDTATLPGHRHLHEQRFQPRVRLTEVRTPKVVPHSCLHYSIYGVALVWFPLTQNSQGEGFFLPFEENKHWTI